MEDKFTQLRSRLVMFIVGIALIISGQTWARTTTLNYEQAVLVSKFAKYIEWPEKSAQASFVIGVYDDVEKHKYFSEFFANKGVKNKDIVVRLVKSTAEAKDVNIIYVPSANKNKTVKLTTSIIRSGDILVVTEGSRDFSSTMIDLTYNKKTSRIVFTFIDENIKIGRLEMPELSTLTNQEENVLPPSPSYIQKNEYAEELLALQNEVTKQKSSVQRLNEALKSSRQKSDQRYNALQDESKLLKAAQKESDEYSKEIKAKDTKLSNLQKQLKAKITTHNGDLQLGVEDKLREQESALKEQEKVLADLNSELTKQKNRSNNTANKLAVMTTENSSLSSFKILFYIFLTIALVALFFAFKLWKKSKETPAQPASTDKHNLLFPVREKQLVKSESQAAFGYIATDVTYAIAESLDEFQEQLDLSKNSAQAEKLKPVITLIDNFNTIAADQDDTEEQSFDLVDYINKMMSLYQVEFNQSNVDYKYSGEQLLKIKSVPGHIALVLLNVVNNALKHGFANKGNGKLTLNVKKSPKGGVNVTVSDDGSGMNKSVLSQVFTPFFTTATDRGYVGVGLSRSYELVKEKLAGDIKIESKEGKGTSVIISLP